MEANDSSLPIVLGGDLSVSTLSDAVQAAFDFAGFATTVQTIAAEIERLQADFTIQYARSVADLRQQQQQALVAVLAAKNEALTAIQLAQAGAGLYRPAQHQPAPLPGHAVPTP